MHNLTAPRRQFRAILWASMASALIGLGACGGPYMDNRDPNPRHAHGHFPKPGDAAEPNIHPGDMQRDPEEAD
jgi:hypothetical protein